MKHKLLQLMIVIIILMMLLPGCNVEKGPFLFGQEEAKDPEFSDVRDLFGFSSRWTSDSDAMDAMFEQLICAMEKQDSEEIKRMFAPNVVTSVGEFDEQLDALLDEYCGEMIGYENGGHVEHTSAQSGNVINEIDGSYDIETTEGVYRMAIRFCSVNTYEEDGTGIVSIYFIHGEDSYMGLSYWGQPTEWTPGITIE